MIKINLIGRKRKKKATPIQVELLVFTSVLAVVFGGIMLFDSTAKAKVAYLEEQVNIRQAEYRKYLNLKREVDGFRRQMDEIQRKIDIVRSLKEGQKGYYKILTDLEKSMPEDVWAESIRFESGRIILSCSSLQVSSVNRFVMNLYETGMFTGIDLERADKKDDLSVEVNNFVINAGLRFD